MTYTSTATGLTYPDGPDLVKSIPDTDRMRDRQLAHRIVTPCASVEDRDTRFPSLGINDSPSVLIGSIDELHEWDGQQWIVSDTVKKRVTASDSMPLWYSDSTAVPLMIKDGELFVQYQRIRRTVTWQIHLRRGDHSNVGGGYYSFYVPVPIDDWINAAAKGMVRLADGREYGYGAGFRDQNRAVIFTNPGRLGTTTFPWKTDDRIGLTGTNLVGGYK